MTDPWTERLSDFVDGELSAPEQQQLEVHLSSCEECSSVLAGLRSVALQAKELVDTPPPADLWPGIAARIGVERASSMGAPVTAKRAATRRGLLDWLDRRFTITVPQAAAAAAGLIAVVGVASWLALGQRSQPTRIVAGADTTVLAPPVATLPSPDTSTGGAPTTTPPLAAEAANVPPRPAAASRGTTVAVAGFDPRYDATIAELQRVLAQERDRLDPKTIQVLETNLKIIDKAVADARRAVESDPSNLYLRNHLASVMKRKADLLRQATLLAEAQGSEG